MNEIGEKEFMKKTEVKIFVQTHTNNIIELYVPFHWKKFKWGKSFEPTPDAKKILRQFKGWSTEKGLI